MLPDLDQSVCLRRTQPERPKLRGGPGAGSGHPKTDRRLQGNGRLRLCRAVSGAARRLRRCLPALTGSVLLVLAAPAGAQAPPTTTPIEHLIVIVGENLSFDNLFGTYRATSGAAVHNLLS